MTDQTDEIRDVLTDAGRTHLAAVSAAATFWSAWAESATSYSKGVTDELTALAGGGTDSGDAIGRITALNREYLRRVTELPTLAVQSFNEGLEKIANPDSPSTGVPGTKSRGRAARAKS